MRKSQKRPGFFTLSTGTIGGAIIMLILNMILGDKAPWFVEKLSASVKDVYSISLDVDEIFDRKHHIKDIDPTVYYIDLQRKLYLNKTPSELWQIETHNPGQLLDGLSVSYVPFFRFSLNMFSQFFQLGKVSQDDITTTTFSRKDAAYKIEFTRESKIGNFALIMNPFEDIDYVKASIRGGTSLLSIGESEMEQLLDETTEESRQFLEKAQSDMRLLGERIIEEKWPTEQIISDHVTVTCFHKRLIERNPNFRLLVQGNKLHIFAILSFLTFVNPELASSNINYIDVSKDNNAVLIDESLSLEKIVINDKLIERTELVRLALIATSSDIIYIVTMNYLYGAGENRAISKEIESLFASFRIVV